MAKDQVPGERPGEALRFLRPMIAYASVSQTSNEAISVWLGEQLRQLGFRVEITEYFDRYGVRKMNVIGSRYAPAATREFAAKANGRVAEGLAYFGHSDVVPAEHWCGPGGDPFTPVAQDDRIYGRGACDMKGSLAAMLAAVARVPADEQHGPLWFVCTADEEVGFEGARQIVASSPAYREMVAAQPVCIIGEPTQTAVVHAHKGIEVFRVVSHGRAAHSSTQRGINANVAMVPMLQLLLDLDRVTQQDPRYRHPGFDPPTLSWTFGVSDGCRATNITPERSVAWVSLRPMPGVDGEDLIDRVRAAAASMGLTFERLHGGTPLWIDPQAVCVQAMCELVAGTPQTVCYSTDGGQFDELHARLVCGPGDIAQAHTGDEWISFEQLHRGTSLYEAAIRRWCIDSPCPPVT